MWRSAFCAWQVFLGRGLIELRRAVPVFNAGRRLLLKPQQLVLETLRNPDTLELLRRALATLSLALPVACGDGSQGPNSASSTFGSSSGSGGESSGSTEAGSVSGRSRQTGGSARRRSMRLRHSSTPSCASR